MRDNRLRTNGLLTEILAGRKHKPGLPVPALLVRLLMGGMGDAFILASRRLEPRKLLAVGYKFRFPELEAALRHGLGAARLSDPVQVTSKRMLRPYGFRTVNSPL